METKNIRRGISLLLSVAVIVSMIFTNTETIMAETKSITEDGQFEYSIGYTEVTIKKYLGDDETVVIPETIEGFPVRTIGESAFSYKEVIEVTGNSIFNISGSAFADCKKLLKINFPQLIRIYTSTTMWPNGQGENYWGAFRACNSLEEVNFPNVQFIDAYAFAGCKNLTTVVVPKLKSVKASSFSDDRPGVHIVSLPKLKEIFVSCKMGKHITNQPDPFAGKYEIRNIHSVTNWNIDEQATCVKEGKRNGVCESCSESVTEIIPIDSTAHDYEDWKTTKEPTCSVIGEKERICKLCQNKETAEIPIDSTVHNYGNWITTKNPTCSTVGEKERVCVDCKNKDIVEIPIDSTAHSFTNYVYNNDAKVGVDGTETAVCDNGCGITDTRTKPGTALEGGGSSGGGGSWIPSMQYPNISEGDGYTTSLSDGGSRVTITIDEDYELVDVFLNGVSKGNVTELSGLRTGDEVVITVISKVDKIQQTLAGVSKKNLLARSSQVKMKNGRKAIKITVINKTGIEFDGIEVFRSMKKDSGYGKKPIFTTKTYKYYNTAVKKGKRYYYRVRGYIEYEGVKYYSDWSARAWRTVK